MFSDPSKCMELGNEEGGSHERAGQKHPTRNTHTQALKKDSQEKNQIRCPRLSRFFE